MAIGHMYAQNKRMKQYHDEFLQPKEFEIGDLVWVYTLKQHIEKFKK